MTTSCAKLAEVLLAGGREALATDGQTAAHVESCPICARLLAGWDSSEEALGEISLQEAPAMTPIDDSNLAPNQNQDEPRVWHVAIADETHGPLTLPEVERFWEDGALDAESMVWAEGMGDWKRLAEVDELGFLRAYPQASQVRLVVAAPTSAHPVLSAGPAAAAVVSPVVFDGASGASTGEGATFAPVGAQLSALVQEELTAEPSAPAAGEVPDEPVAALPAWQAPVMPDLTWQPPKPEPRRESRTRSIVLASVMASAATAAAVVVGVVVLRPPPSAPAIAARVQPATAEAPANPVAEAGPINAPRPPATTAAETVVENHPTGPSKAGRKAASAGGERAKSRPGAKPARDAQSAGDLSDDAAKPASAPVAAALRVEDIKAGVKNGMNAVMGCIKAARQAGELTPGTHTLQLSWNISAAGTVSDARLTGPATVLGTTLPSCFAKGMSGWRFPASRAGAPVRNFPFGPFTIK